MKIKILVVPFLLVLTVILCIWLVYPVYSNGNNGLKEKYAQLKKEKNKLKGVQNKSNNVKKLFGEITSSSENLNILYEFIPLNSKEEEIEDNINYLASVAGLSVLKISLNEINNNSLKKSDVGMNVNANVDVSGNYEALKKFIDSLNKLRRYSNIETFSIAKTKKNVTADTEVDTTETLNARLVINFVFMNKVKLTDNDANDPIFSAQNLNTDVISQIKNEKSTNILQLNIGDQGKTNPFMP